MGTIRTVVLTRMIRALDERCPRADFILHEVGLRRSVLDDSYNMVSLRQYMRLFEWAADVLDDRWFGLRLGVNTTPADLGPIGALCANARTLGQALNDLTQYITALQTGTSLTIQHRRDCAYLTYAVLDASVGPHVQDTEFTLSATVHLIRSIFGQRWSPLDVTFKHSGSARSDAARKILSAPVSFGCPANSIMIGKLDLEMHPLTRGGDDLRAILERHIADLMPNSVGLETITSRIDDIVTLLIPHGVPTLERVARELGISARSLQRALAQEGTSLRSIVQNQRQRIAERLLAEADKSHADIAQALGYADATVFWRAYKSWRGVSPSAVSKRPK